MRGDRSAFLHYHGRSREETENCRDYVQLCWPEEVAHRMRIAEEAVKHQFLFDLPWDMEPTSETVSFGKEIDWTFLPKDDPEFIYQMNRHRFWVCMGQAYAVTGDEKYPKAFVGQLLHWIRSNPITEETKRTTWRTIEAGIRGENWIKAMGYMAESQAVTDEVWYEFLRALAMHGEYLAAGGRPFGEKSNWGVLENSGLYVIGKLMERCMEGREQRLGTEYAALAIKGLMQQIRIQVMDDGVHWEQSPMYHNEVLKCLLEVLRVAKRYGEDLPEDFALLVKKMAYADRYWQKPDGTQPAGGDSDRTDIRDILTIAACQFRDPVLKSGGFCRMDYEGIWDYGMEGARIYGKLPSRNPEERFCWMKDSGNWYLRSGWGRKDDYLHVRCGGLGGGHGHFDKMHLDLVVNGEDVLIDPGRFTYVDGPVRRQLKSALAHNTLTVDHEEYTECLDSWGVSGLNPAVSGMGVQKGAYTLIQCGHLGYIQKGVYLNRRILALGTRIYVIVDEFYSGQTHTYQQQFHLAPQIKAALQQQEGSNEIWLEGSSFQARMICLSEGVWAGLEEFPVSLRYNQMEPGEMAVFSRTAAGNGSLVTVILCDDKPSPEEAPAGIQMKARRVSVEAPANGRILNSSEADGVALSWHGREFAAVFAHQETGGSCEYIGSCGKFGVGRVMAAELDHKQQETEGMTVLCW